MRSSWPEESPDPTEDPFSDIAARRKERTKDNRQKKQVKLLQLNCYDIIRDDLSSLWDRSERRIAKSRTWESSSPQLARNHSFFARPWVPFDQFIQGFKTFLRARPPGFVSLPCFVSFSSVDRHRSRFSSRSLSARDGSYVTAGTSRERNFLRR